QIDATLFYPAWREKVPRSFNNLGHGAESLGSFVAAGAKDRAILSFRVDSSLEEPAVSQKARCCRFIHVNLRASSAQSRLLESKFLVHSWPESRASRRTRAAIRFPLRWPPPAKTS